MAQWIVAFVAAITLIITVIAAAFRSDREQNKTVERVKTLESEVTRLGTSLKVDIAHLETASDQAFLNLQMQQAELGRLKQEMADHRKQDDERFSRIEQMHSEIRADLKELLKRR